ncbi:MAG: hypothetical protein ACYCYO_10680 [Bacilli bacterium]
MSQLVFTGVVTPGKTVTLGFASGKRRWPVFRWETLTGYRTVLIRMIPLRKPFSSG